MKRYLTGYSKDTLTIRDRKTGLEKRIPHAGKEIADIVQEAVKSTNYYLNSPKNGKIKLKSISDIDYKPRKTNKYWGEFPPVNMRWEREILEEKEKQKYELLNRILFGD